jgi:hypothetical protein
MNYRKPKSFWKLASYNRNDGGGNRRGILPWTART